MTHVNKNIDITLNKIKNSMGNSSDFFARTININNKKIMYCFLESTSSDDKISNYLVKNLSEDIRFTNKRFFDELFIGLENTIPNSKLKIITNIDEIPYHLASGFTCIFVSGYEKCIVIETKANLDRSIQESSSEAVIRGPKDSFTENHMTNIGLIRKRIKDKNLFFDEIIVGRRTKTKVSVVYINGITNKDWVNKTKKIIKKIDIDGILDSSYVREFLSPREHSAFPKIISTERPDFTCASLLDGKICILVENSPYALLMPSVLSDFLHSAEDNYQKPFNISFTRILRTIAFFITILTPAIYIAVTNFNQEMIPDRLLISLAVQREGVPFPTPFEVFMLGITFEILRESDIRIPKVTGTAISVVGALVLGDAAVNAGIISPIVVIIIAITSICGLVFTDIDFINAIRWWRMFFIFCATLMGIIGIVCGGIIFVTKLASLESLGIPYLAPLSPLYFKDNNNTSIRLPRNKIFRRPTFLKLKNEKKLEESNE